jgi:hypothetical protein
MLAAAAKKLYGNRYKRHADPQNRLSCWAFNQMLIGVVTRKYARSVRLLDGDLAGQAKRATTKPSTSCADRSVAPTQSRV